MHNFFARVNVRPASAPTSFGAPDFFACVRVKRVQVFFCVYVGNGDCIGTSCLSHKEARKFSELQSDGAARDADERNRRRITLWAAAFTHKIKWSHCYFFPRVVIGL